MTTTFRMLAWLLAAALAFATLGPARFRPLSRLGQDGEHLLAFVLLGLVLGLAYPRNRLLTVTLAIAVLALVEILQIWAPGRHARFEDFAVNALAACIGVVAAAALQWIVARTRQSRASRSTQKIPAGTSSREDLTK